MRVLMIAAALAAASAVPALARTTDAIPEPSHHAMTPWRLPHEAQAETDRPGTPQAAPIVEARRLKRR